MYAVLFLFFTDGKHSVNIKRQLAMTQNGSVNITELRSKTSHIIHLIAYIKISYETNIPLYFCM